MRLLLHIGTAKTGSTALQTALHRGVKQLHRQGVLYPRPPRGQVNHGLLVLALSSATKVPREYASRGEDLAAMKVRGRALWADIERQVRASSAEVAVLSGEYLFALQPAQLEELRAMLGRVFSGVEVVCYVRDPADHYVAMLQQELRASYTIVSPDQFNLRARARINRYQDAFDGRVHVRSAQRSDLLEGDIVRDFMEHHLPQAMAALPTTAEDLNPSMSGEAMCIMQDLRRYAWPEEDRRFDDASTLVWRRLNELRAAGPQARAELRAPIRATLLHAHRRDLDFLEAQFDIHLPRPDDTPTDGPPPAGWSSLDVHDLLAVEPDDVERVRSMLLRDLAGRARAGWRRR